MAYGASNRSYTVTTRQGKLPSGKEYDVTRRKLYDGSRDVTSKVEFGPNKKLVHQKTVGGRIRGETKVVTKTGVTPGGRTYKHHRDLRGGQIPKQTIVGSADSSYKPGKPYQKKITTNTGKTYKYKESYDKDGPRSRMIKKGYTTKAK